MKIYFYEITEQWQKDFLSEKLKGQELVFEPNVLNDTHLPKEDAEIVSIFVNSRITEKVLSSLPSLKFLTTRSTGFDHINLDLLKNKGASAAFVPTYGENTVAEYTFALLLDLSRKVYPSIKRIKEEGLFSTENLRGFDLLGKTLGVIGTGHIGTYVVKIANGFGMKILAYDPHPNEKLAKEFGFTYAGLEDLLKQSDIVTLHVPYLPETHHLINKDNIKLFKKGSVLINTARGGLVDTEGLVWALKEGILAGAGLDVIEEEGFIKEEADMLINGHPKESQLKTVLADHELMQMPNVIITPHNAFNSKEALERILNTTVKNIESYLDNKPVNLIT